MTQDEILKYLEEQEKCLTLKEIGLHFGFSQPAVTRQIKQLAKYKFVYIFLEGKMFKVKVAIPEVVKYG